MTGRAVMRRLSNQEAGFIPVEASLDGNRVDFRDPIMTQQLIGSKQPDAIVICAGRVGGIADNIRRPVDYIHDNTLIQCNFIKAANAYNVPKLITLGSSCIYPRQCQQPMKEKMFLTGNFEPTNQSYAVAKTVGIEMCRAYWNQFSRNYYAIMPPNLYGPYDNFRPDQSHVVASLLRKAKEVEKGEQLEVWGTGKPKREFMHVDDLASAVEFCLTNVDAWDCDPNGFINAGTNSSHTITQLAEAIGAISDTFSSLRFDQSKPDGMPVKQMDSSRINELGWSHSISLLDGLDDAWGWMNENWESDVIRR